MIFKEIRSAFDDSRTWAAATDTRTYVIFQDGGQFTASHKPLGLPTAKATYVIDYDAGVATFQEAVAACEQAERDA